MGRGATSNNGFVKRTVSNNDDEEQVRFFFLTSKLVRFFLGKQDTIQILSPSSQFIHAKRVASFQV
jgi:hypothetical protein